MPTKVDNRKNKSKKKVQLRFDLDLEIEVCHEVDREDDTYEAASRGITARLTNKPAELIINELYSIIRELEEIAERKVGR